MEKTVTIKGNATTVRKALNLIVRQLSERQDRYSHPHSSPLNLSISSLSSSLDWCDVMCDVATNRSTSHNLYSPRPAFEGAHSNGAAPHALPSHALPNGAAAPTAYNNGQAPYPDGSASASAGATNSAASSYPVHSPYPVPVQPQATLSVVRHPFFVFSVRR
jgi:hypothetical protein